MNEIVKEATRLLPELAAIRADLHRHPELGNHEFRTAERIEEELHRLGIETRRLLDTAVVGTIRGGKACIGASGGSRTAALRADMDALPLSEETGASFASEIPGRMHACGHDVHMTALLGAAKLLAAHRAEFAGEVRLIFQPDEEGNGGAKRLIDLGVLDGVSAIFGAHVSPELPAGHVGIRYGKFYAASDMFTVRVHGRSAHGAEREKGIDALASAAALVTALLGLPEQVTQDRCVLTVGALHAGTAGNILPGEAELEGIIRTLGPKTRAEMKRRFFDTVEQIAASTGTTAEIDYRGSYPGVVNDDGMTALAEREAVALFGEGKVHRIGEPTMTTEDFGYYLTEVPGTFYHIGAGCSLPLHNAGFLPAEESISTAAALHVAAVLAFLRS